MQHTHTRTHGRHTRPDHHHHHHQRLVRVRQGAKSMHAQHNTTHSSTKNTPHKTRTPPNHTPQAGPHRRTTPRHGPHGQHNRARSRTHTHTHRDRRETLRPTVRPRMSYECHMNYEVSLLRSIAPDDHALNESRNTQPALVLRHSQRTTRTPPSSDLSRGGSVSTPRQEPAPLLGRCL